jgi:hypothetical protein
MWAGPTVAVAVSIQAVAPAWPIQAKGDPVHTERAQGVQVKFVATPWRPDVFAAFAEGGSPAPPSWAFARLELSDWFQLDSRRLTPGKYAMVLAPKAGSLPMTLELRRVSGREFFTDAATLTPPPPGETVYKVPVTFGPNPEPVPVLDLTLASYGSSGAVLTIRYGDRQLVQELARTEP